MVVGNQMMDDETYVPLSQRTLRKLDQLVLQTGFSEDRIVGMALDNFLACLRQYENDNAPPLPPGALSSDSAGCEGRPALGGSKPESRPEL